MIRWGIIGAGKIAQRFVKSLAHESNSELYAVSCRTLSKAQQFADTYHAQKAYGSYVELDPMRNFYKIQTLMQYILPCHMAIIIYGQSKPSKQARQYWLKNQQV